MTQPMLFEAQGQIYIKADNTPMPVSNNSCFDDCVKFLLFAYFVFNVCYPAELKVVFGVLERVMSADYEAQYFCRRLSTEDAAVVGNKD